MPTIGDIRRASDVDYKSAQKQIWMACPKCGTERWIFMSKGEAKYSLCLSCAAGRREENSNWKGGRSKHGGYNLVLMPPGHLRAKSHGKRYIEEHILVWERVHGKTLPDGWIIHHLNGVKDDNRPRNLVAMPKGEHHYAMHLESIKARIRELEAEVKLLEKALNDSQLIFYPPEN